MARTLDVVMKDLQDTQKQLLTAKAAENRRKPSTVELAWPSFRRRSMMPLSEMMLTSLILPQPPRGSCGGWHPHSVKNARGDNRSPWQSRGFAADECVSSRTRSMQCVPHRGKRRCFSSSSSSRCDSMNSPRYVRSIRISNRNFNKIITVQRQKQTRIKSNKHH
jgi:hypothetical protein